MGFGRRGVAVVSFFSPFSPLRGEKKRERILGGHPPVPPAHGLRPRYPCWALARRRTGRRARSANWFGRLGEKEQDRFFEKLKSAAWEASGNRMAVQ